LDPSKISPPPFDSKFPAILLKFGDKRQSVKNISAYIFSGDRICLARWYGIKTIADLVKANE
jgi:hypothetical protein